MRIFEVLIPPIIQDYLQNILRGGETLSTINKKINLDSGICNFFDTDDELIECRNNLKISISHVQEPDRTEYGDFQTNNNLAFDIITHLAKKLSFPDVLLEPTCGKGSFILAGLKVFPNLKAVYGVEIYKPYLWETKFSILAYYLNHCLLPKPKITLFHNDVFGFNFKNIAKKIVNENLLIVGNPPWVTNAMLGGLNSNNLPAKSNFKNHGGLDAITGKGNFDIAEAITLMLLDSFESVNGNLALLVKNSVIKTIVFDQIRANHRITDLEKYSIDSKKEFNVSVEASLFSCHLNSKPALQCEVFDFYDRTKSKSAFGWVNEKFVSNVESYVYAKSIDGTCPFEWRQGLKHDCTAVMEIEKADGFYTNTLKEEVELEEELVYGLLKSSDLKAEVVNKSRKFTIVTQKRVGQNTAHIRQNYPKTYNYLKHHQNLFAARKSSIYRNKPEFSIFGIGEYSFKPYKVAISGLYKTFHFTLILPQNEKTLMLDDTCYMLGFDDVEFAAYTYILLNAPISKRLLQAITFSDAKRTFTKDVLMRVDLRKAAKLFSIDELKVEVESLNSKYDLSLGIEKWRDYLQRLYPVEDRQLEIFVQS